MAGMINQLVSVMKEQAERYNELLGLSLEEKDVIVQNDIDNLQKITNLKKIVITQNNRLESKRISLAKDIAEVMGYGEGEIELSKLIELMGAQPEATELTEVAKQLREIMEKLRAANDENKLLLENSLEFVEYSINVIRSSVEPELPEFPAKYSGGDSTATSFNATS
jgi:flagellar biosynthesis/type III secretory pathway chaperone